MKDPADMNKDELATELHGYNPAIAVDVYKRMTEDALRNQLVFTRSVIGGGTTPPPSSPDPSGETPSASPDLVVLVEVPHLLRLSVEQAKEKIMRANLHYTPSKVTKENDPYAKREEVIYQKPTAGEMVPQGTIMELTVSIPETPPKKPKVKKTGTSLAKALIFPSDLRKKIDEIKD